MVRSIDVEIDPATWNLLLVLGDSEAVGIDASNHARAAEETLIIRAVLAVLIDHAQQGVYRSGAWEREWLTQVFGFDWLESLEPDPAKPLSWGHCRPRGSGT